jgi:hypothetical protein
MASNSNTKKMADPKQLDWDLLKELECPVCFEYLESPIKLCENGHSICDGCGLQVPKCPSCRGTFTEARNFTLERIAATAIYPCKNREAGCGETFTVNHKNSHKSECLFQSTHCPFRKFSEVKCPWYGSLSDIAGHVRSEHGREFSEHRSGGVELTLQNFNKEQRYCKAIFMWGKLFYLVWETTQLTFYFSVFHVGHMKEEEEFVYEFKLGKYRDKILIRGLCRSYLWAKSEVLKIGECVTLHYRTAQKYVNESQNLPCEIEILKKCTFDFSFVPTERILAAPSKNPAPSEDA